jgi:8-oxo-dGTP pyrophosphatase MutT (NUDIX family)
MPGGKRDAADGTASCTALRETREEVGIRPEDVNVLAELRPTRTKVVSPSAASTLCDVDAHTRGRPSAPQSRRPRQSKLLSRSDFSVG